MSTLELQSVFPRLLTSHDKVDKYGDKEGGANDGRSNQVACLREHKGRQGQA